MIYKLGQSSSETQGDEMERTHEPSDISFTRRIDDRHHRLSSPPVALFQNENIIPLPFVPSFFPDLLRFSGADRLAMIQAYELAFEEGVGGAKGETFRRG